MLEYIDFPGSSFEEHRTLNVFLGGTGDYYLTIGDGKKEITFRYCINGGFEHRCPETTKAISDLFDAFTKETQK